MAWSNKNGKGKCVLAFKISKYAWFPVPKVVSKIVFLLLHCTFLQSYDKKVDGPGFGIVCVGTSARFQMHSTFENVLPLLVHREREQKSLRSSSSSYARAAAAVAGAP